MSSFSDLFADAHIISAYTVQDGINDGQLIPVLPHRWPEITGGKPFVATNTLAAEITVAGIMECWNLYVEWRTNVMATLPEDEQMFTTEMNSRTVWLLEDGAAFTIMFPEDY